MSTFRTTFDPLGASRWPSLGGARRLTASSLMGASAVLSRIADRLLVSASPAPCEASCLEFHPEGDGRHGALYVDGMRVGQIPGVMRL